MEYHKEFLEEMEASRNLGTTEENRMTYTEFRGMKESQRLDRKFKRRYGRNHCWAGL